jgi:uncharacterized protein (TIRG00374 family)
MRRAAALLIVLALLGTLAVPLWLGGRSAVLTSLTLSPTSYLAIGALGVAAWMLRAMKQRLLLRRLGIAPGAWRILAISLATDCAFLTTPGGVGGYAAGIYYLRGIGASYASASAVAAADQVLDMLFFAVAMPLAALGVAQTVALPAAFAHGAAWAGCAALGALALLALARRPLARCTLLRERRERVRAFVAEFAAQAKRLGQGSPGYVAGVVACTGLQWFARYGVLWLILDRLGHRVPFSLALLLQGVMLHVAQWTGMPAGGGSADLGLAAALAAWVPPAALASALLLWRVATLYLSVVVGLVAMAALRVRGNAQRGAAARVAD